MGPVGRRVVAERELRVAVNGFAAIAGALALVVLSPWWTLALTPLVLGVPHVLADLRYLVLRPGLQRRPALWLAWGVPLAAVVLGGGTAVGLTAMVGSAAAARGSRGRRLAIGALGTGLVAGALVADPWASIALAHAHNLIAVGMWWAWRPRTSSMHLSVIAAFVVVYLALVGGFLDPWLGALPVAVPAALDGPHHVAWLANGVPAPWGLRLVVAFAFAQGVHYSAWLRLIPDDARDRETARTLRRTLAELVADCGLPLVLLAVGCLVVLAGWALVDVAGARTGYMQFARFHGMLELAAVALWACEGRAR
jgi:hypothetical protein